MKDAASSITLAEINEKHKVPTTHAYSSKNSVDKTITLGKVEGSVEVFLMFSVYYRVMNRFNLWKLLTTRLHLCVYRLFVQLYRS